MTRVSLQNGMLLTGAAGPVTNVALAVVGGLGFRVCLALGAPAVVLYIFAFFLLINLVLAFFNLIPIPPLDGSRVVQRFLSGGALRAYSSLEPLGFVIVLLLVFVLPSFTGVDVIGWYFSHTVYPLAQLLGGQQVISALVHVVG